VCFANYIKGEMLSIFYIYICVYTIFIIGCRTYKFMIVCSEITRDKLFYEAFDKFIYVNVHLVS